MARLSRLALLIGAFAAGYVQLPDGTAASSTQASVFLIGDSLSVGTSWYLPEILPREQVRIDARVDRRLAEGLAVLRARRASLPSVIAVSLGTNDDPSRVSRFRVGIREVVRLAGPSRCVIWATVSRPPFHGISYAGYNRALRREAARNPLFLLVDWAEMIARNPRLLRPDHVHGSTIAYQQRARATARAIRGCQTRLQTLAKA